VKVAPLPLEGASEAVGLQIGQRRCLSLAIVLIHDGELRGGLPGRRGAWSSTTGEKSADPVVATRRRVLFDNVRP
jgi:hypothetical protein